MARINVFPVLTSVGIFAAMSVYAQDAGDKQPLTSILSDGGRTMWVLVFLSVATVALASYFAMRLRMSTLLPDEFKKQAEVASEMGDLKTLQALCGKYPSAAASVVAAATRMLSSNPDTEYMVLRDVVQDEGTRQANSIWQRIQSLNDIAVIAPMIGLLGTVLGMREGFVGLSSELGVKPLLLTAGVTKALVTTAAGLFVGIGAMVLYAFFRTRTERLVAQLEETCSGIMQRLYLHAHDGTSETDEGGEG